MCKVYSYNKKKPFCTWQFGKIGVLVNFIINKLKSKRLVCLSFHFWQFFLREREKIFYTYSGPNWHCIFHPRLLSFFKRNSQPKYFICIMVHNIFMLRSFFQLVLITPSPWLLLISLVQFSLIRSFKKVLKSLSHADFIKKLLSSCIFLIHLCH